MSFANVAKCGYTQVSRHGLKDKRTPQCDPNVLTGLRTHVDTHVNTRARTCANAHAYAHV